MEEYKMDVSILLIFFNRSETLEKVFSSIKKAKPRTLLLWQDGPRNDNNDDIVGIKRCRDIVSDIDWKCDVHYKYHETNIGCDPSTFYAQKWAFSIVDKCIVLEDDMVPSQSFYMFCEELLLKYENDERINHICGINFVEDRYVCQDDYLFSYYGTGAWASWRRVAEGWDEEYSFLNETSVLDNVKKKYPPLFEESYRIALDRKRRGKAYWETILGFNCYMNNRLVIIPKINMVTNIGVTAGATHGSSLKLMNKRIRNLFFMEAKEMQFPIKHPKYVVPDYCYLDEMSKINCLGRPFLRFVRKIEYVVKRVFYYFLDKY